MREVVAFIGRAGSGKDYQCGRLEEQGYKKIAFADILREMTSDILGIDYKCFLQNYEELKRSTVFNNLTVRNVMENLGSTIRKYKPDFFISAVISKITDKENRNSNICISDMRYINEFKQIHNFCSCWQDTNFRAVFCDYRSDRYQATNDHESAYLSNKLVELGYKDLQPITIEDIKNIEQNT